MFDTKIAIVVRDNLPVWQKLNVTAFLMSRITGAAPEILGEPYLDAAGNIHLSLSVQPVIVLSAEAAVLRYARNRATKRGVATAVYIQEMFATGHDEANRAVFLKHGPNGDNVVGIATRPKSDWSIRSPRVRGCTADAQVFPLRPDEVPRFDA